MAAPDITAMAGGADHAEAQRPARRIDFLKNRNWYFAFSLVIIIPGVLSMIFKGFLLGIDFQGGTEFLLRFSHSPTLAQVEAAAGPNALVQQTAQGGYVIRTSPLVPTQYSVYENQLTTSLGPIDQSRSQVNTVGPTIAQEIVVKALVAIVVA